MVPLLCTCLLEVGPKLAKAARVLAAFFLLITLGGATVPVIGRYSPQSLRQIGAAGSGGRALLSLDFD
jgi:hypothetical protein